MEKLKQLWTAGDRCTCRDGWPPWWRDSDVWIAAGVVAGAAIVGVVILAVAIRLGVEAVSAKIHGG